MVPTDWTPACYSGIARREATGRFVLGLAPRPGEHQQQPENKSADVDQELLTCARRLIAHTAAHYRRTGWLAGSGLTFHSEPGQPTGLTSRARRSGKSSHLQQATGDAT